MNPDDRTRGRYDDRDFEEAFHVVRDAWGDRIVDTSAVDPAVEARELHERLSNDPSWAGRVPSLASLEDAARQNQASWRLGEDERVQWLRSQVELSLEAVLPFAPSGVSPVIVHDSAAPHLNARCFELSGPDRSYCIQFHAGFPFFINVITRAIAAALPPGFPYLQADIGATTSYIDERLRDEPDRTVRPFSEVAVTWAATGAPMTEMLPVEPDRQRLTRLLWDAAEIFVLAHEYAHHELAHHGVATPAMRASGVLPAHTPFGQELQADEIALGVTAHALARADEPPELASIGAWCFFSAGQAFELATCILGTGSHLEGLNLYLHATQRADPMAYPSPQLRKNALHLRLLTEYGDSNPGLNGSWQTCERVHALLSEQTARHAHHVAGQGVRPADPDWAGKLL